MDTKPCMSSHNKRITILVYTKDCSDTEGYKNQTNFVAHKMAASEVLSELYIDWNQVSGNTSVENCSPCGHI